MSHSGKWTKQSNIQQFQFDIFNQNGRRTIFGKQSYLIGSFEGTRAIVCMRRGERGDQRRSSQRYQSSTQIPIHDHGQIYLDPSGGDCDTEQGIDREDEESGFEVKTLTQNCLSMSHLFNEVFVPALVTSITLHACTPLMSG